MIHTNMVSRVDSSIRSPFDVVRVTMSMVKVVVVIGLHFCLIFDKIVFMEICLIGSKISLSRD